MTEDHYDNEEVGPEVHRLMARLLNPQNDDAALKEVVDSAEREQVWEARETIIRVRKEAEAEVARLKQLEAIIKDLIAFEMGMGEAFVVGDTIVFKDTVSAGKAIPNAEAIRQHAEALEPFGLAPKMVEQLPTVSALGNAKKQLAEVGIRWGSLVEWPPKEPGLRTRKV